MADMIGKPKEFEALRECRLPSFPPLMHDGFAGVAGGLRSSLIDKSDPAEPSVVCQYTFLWLPALVLVATTTDPKASQHKTLSKKQMYERELGITQYES